MTRAGGLVTEDCDAVLLRYVVKDKALPILRADIASITYSVIDRVTGTPVTGHDNVALDKTVVIFDTLQTTALDASWPHAGGYNFRHELAGSAFPIGERWYSYECWIVRPNGATIPVYWDLYAERTDRS